MNVPEMNVRHRAEERYNYYEFRNGHTEPSVVVHMYIYRHSKQHTPVLVAEISQLLVLHNGYAPETDPYPSVCL